MLNLLFKHKAKDFLLVENKILHNFDKDDPKLQR